MKKAMKVLGVVAGVILVLVLTLPFFIQVDQFRPKIVKVVNENINGELQLGSMRLSLWGRVHIGIDGLKVFDAEKHSVISVKDAAFDLPYSSLFAGSPLITLVMKEPEIKVVKGLDGKLNLMGLMKVASAPPPAPTGAAPSPPVLKKQIELPAIVVNAHFGVSVENAKLVYQDAALALTNTVDRLNLRVKDFSLSRKTDLELWADLKTKMGNDLSLEGPLKFSLSLTPDVTGGEFKSAAVSAHFSADDLLVEKGGLFIKKKGIPAHLNFNAALDQTSFRLKEAALFFHNAEVMLSGVFHKENGADFKFEAKPIDLKSWSELVPMLAEYELEGNFGLSGDLKGKPEAPLYSANATLSGLSAKGPHLKSKPVIDGTVQVLTNRIEKFSFDLKAPGNGIHFEGKVNSFLKPQITFTLASPKGMDLDQWIEFPKPEEKPAGNPTGSPAGSPAGNTHAASGKAPPSDLDAMLDPLRKNEIAKAMGVDGTVSIAFMKAKGFKMEDLYSRIQMKDLVASLSGIRLKIYEGSMTGSFSTDLKPKEPLYTMNFSVVGFNLQKAVESQFQSLKNTLTGKLTASLQGGGSSFNPEAAKKHLQMKGDFKVLDGAFQSMDIAKMANQAISGSLGKIAEKVPALKGKGIKMNPNADSRYDLISSSFTIRNGVLEAPNFIAKASPKRGVDLKGYTKMGLIDESLDAKWELMDTQRVTGADQLDVEIAGKTIRNFLAKSEKDPVVLPITIGCKWSAPCMNYGLVPEYLAGVAANRLGGVAKEVVKQKVQDTLKKSIQEGVGNAIKGLFGR